VAEPILVEGDLILYLVTKYRALLAGYSELSYVTGVETAAREPSPDADEPPTYPLVVFGDNGGDDTSFITSEADVRVSVLAGSKQNPKPAMDLAHLVRGLRSQLPGVGDDVPVAASLRATRPTLVPEDSDHARAYFLLTVAVGDHAL
jgi:hypothetical protein